MQYAQRNQKAQITQSMQIKALFLCALFTLSSAAPSSQQGTTQIPAETEPPATAEASPDGQVEYLLTYSQNITESALQTKCKNLNCTRLIYGVINALVVSYDPSGINTLSVDPLLSSAAENIQVRLDYGFVSDVLPRTIDSVLPAWHLDRINQFALPLDGQYASNLTGVGVNIYMLDTGIDANHSEFLTADGTRSRVVSGWSFDGTNNTDDCNGHGTATASLAGGRTLGTAPNATLYAVRAVSCDGQAQIADIVAGLNWIALNAIQPAIISMSVGTSIINDPLQLAVNNTISLYNVTIVASAGNDGTDSCTATPARSVYVAAIGATDIDDKRPAFSNHGKCVNAYAPGVDVRCAGLGNTFIYDSGTSMACPIVAGLAAGYLEFNPSLKYYDIVDIIYFSRSRGYTATIDPPVIQLPVCASSLVPDFTNSSRLQCLDDMYV